MSHADEIRAFITAEFLQERPGYELTDTEDMLENDVIDSLGIMLLVEWIESHFGVTIDAEDVVIDNFETVNAVAALVASKSFGWMNFEWADEQLRYREAVVAFARTRLDGDVIAGDAAGTFDREAWRRCGEFGILGLPVPAEHGGQGADPLTTLLAMEALGYGCRDNGLLFSLNAHLWSAVVPLVRFGSDDQQQRWLPPMCAGEAIGVQAMTEPDFGSDAYSLRTTATPAEDGSGGWVINGSKTFITNAPVADVFIVFATTRPGSGWAGLTAFVVEAGTPGLTVGKPFEKMGLRTSPMSELVFADCAVPASSMLGRKGNGMAIFNHSMEWERSSILATTVGTMQRQLERCVDYAKSRQQFGQPIGKFQAVANRIVDMKVRLEAGRLLLYQAGWMRTHGKTTAADASIVKLFLSEAFVQSSLDAVQIHGGAGYMTETELERDVRDALASRIYSGTSDIQRNVIAASLGL